VHQAAQRLQVAPSPAFRWRHRFLSLAQQAKSALLSGIAEADETFLLRSSKVTGPRNNSSAAPLADSPILRQRAKSFFWQAYWVQALARDEFPMKKAAACAAAFERLSRDLLRSCTQRTDERYAVPYS